MWSARSMTDFTCRIMAGVTLRRGGSPFRSPGMPVNRSIEFFDKQFEQQVRDREFRLNPFEEMALPFLRGRVLDLGCGMGNLAIEAARRGCSVVALDSSAAAIQRICLLYTSPSPRD